MIKVLVIDDDFMVAKVHAGFVNKEPGFTVVGVAHSASDAVKAATSLSPDLALLDIHLPDMNGLELLQRLREVQPELDVIVISAAREMDTVRKALRGGIVHYLMKPFSWDDLRERLKHYAKTYQPLHFLRDKELEQADVNLLFGMGSQSRRPLPKGCSAETMSLVESIVRQTPEPISATETAEKLGTSRVSARRYLEYLAEENLAQVNLRYGGVGRPERRYSWNG
ncbi:response regulator [Arthrobacter sp. NIO-1057]|uniref:response regulator n=1 Tax=Arthrobacter sp. NIO-1057 TaxID=993071 RepID=UPI00071D92BE|nr:response regulator [Arthrobacter sp. NIO-1057]KSU66401.1 two-component system response regulator [Arthrobacter sp. NIO-1057]SCC13213.1 Response regulator of citrate/malate metabolism [Arthrobacter sp. NIO-1057]